MAMLNNQMVDPWTNVDLTHKHWDLTMEKIVIFCQHHMEDSTNGNEEFANKTHGIWMKKKMW
jgi:hypothetical protein